MVEANGGKVLGAAYFPIGNTDFASQLLRAQSSGAQVIGLAAVGGDQVNAIKQASEFGLTRGNGKTLAGFLIYITDINALGLEAAQGLALDIGILLGRNGRLAGHCEAFLCRAQRDADTKSGVGLFGPSRHFLKAMAQAGTRDAAAIGRAMRALPVDYFGRPASVRADGPG